LTEPRLQKSGFYEYHALIRLKIGVNHKRPNAKINQIALKKFKGNKTCFSRSYTPWQA
jgi:hypothetical protein